MSDGHAEASKSPTWAAPLLRAIAGCERQQVKAGHSDGRAGSDDPMATARLILAAFAIAFLGWLVAGCATTKWSHPTADDQQFKADDSECEKLAASSVGHPGYPARAGALPSPAGLDQSKRVNQAYERCMMGKGWVKP